MAIRTARVKGSRSKHLNRRAFLSLSSAAVAGLIWDPELLLWRPPKTMIVVPEMPLVRVSFAQLVAATYDEVLRERMKDGQFFWHDERIVREMAKQAYQDAERAVSDVLRERGRR